MGPSASPQTRRRTATIAASTIAAIALFSSTAAAQSVGDGMCGTPLATFINNAAPFLIGAVMVGGLLVAGLAHGYGGLVRDPHKAEDIFAWRNRAGMAAIGAPLLVVIAEMFIGFAGLQIASCINLLPI